MRGFFERAPSKTRGDTDEEEITNAAQLSQSNCVYLPVNEMLRGVVGKITRSSLEMINFRPCFGFLRVYPFFVRIHFESTSNANKSIFSRLSDYGVEVPMHSRQTNLVKSKKFHFSIFGSVGELLLLLLLNLAIIKIFLLFLQMCLTSVYTLNTHASSGEGAFRALSSFFLNE